MAASVCSASRIGRREARPRALPERPRAAAGRAWPSRRAAVCAAAGMDAAAAAPRRSGPATPAASSRPPRVARLDHRRGRVEQRLRVARVVRARRRILEHQQQVPGGAAARRAFVDGAARRARPRARARETSVLRSARHSCCARARTSCDGTRLRMARGADRRGRAETVAGAALDVVGAGPVAADAAARDPGVGRPARQRRAGRRIQPAASEPEGRRRGARPSSSPASGVWQGRQTLPRAAPARPRPRQQGRRRRGAQQALGAGALAVVHGVAGGAADADGPDVVGRAPVDGLPLRRGDAVEESPGRVAARARALAARARVADRRAPSRSAARPRRARSAGAHRGRPRRRRRAARSSARRSPGSRPARGRRGSRRRPAGADRAAARASGA